MQQAELIEIGILQKEAVDNYNKYGTTLPTKRDISIYECRQYNLKLKAEQERKREYWNKIQETRIYNLKLLAQQKENQKQQQDLKLLEMVKVNPMVLSSVR